LDSSTARSDKTFLWLDRAGTDWSYCNGEIAPGSSKKTPYIGSPFAQPRHFAHTMQHSGVKRVWLRKEGKNRESAISLAQASNRSNGVIADLIR
jgi:hypothetical protein